MLSANDLLELSLKRVEFPGFSAGSIFVFTICDLDVKQEVEKYF